MFRDKERHPQHRTRLFFFAAVESGVGQGGRRQLDFTAKVKDLGDFGRLAQAVKAQFIKWQLEPSVDLACRQVFVEQFWRPGSQRC